MRDIIFRGKLIDNGEWVEGYLVISDERYFIGIFPECVTSLCYPDDIYTFTSFVEIIPSTLGQYTGLTDKHEEKIFEGDIISILVEEDRSPWEPNWIYYEKAKVYFDTKRYGWHVEFSDYDKLSLEEYDETDIEIIGNIHDNPELLKGADNGETTCGCGQWLDSNGFCSYGERKD